MRALSLRKLGLLSGGLCLVLLVLAMPGFGQQAVEPYGELATAECYGHHKAEGFRSMDLFPEVISEVPKGQSFPFRLTIVNPWLHDIVDLSAYVNISDAPGLEFPGAKPPALQAFPDETITSQPTSYGRRTYDIPVEDNATLVVVTLQGEPGEAPAPGVDRRTPRDYHLQVVSPDGSLALGGAPTLPPTPNRPGQLADEIRVNQSALFEQGPGTWRAQVSFHGLPAEGRYTLTTSVYYNLSQASELVLRGPASLSPGEQHTFEFTILARDVEALQAMRYGGRGTAHHVHTDRNIGDDGDYDKWNTLVFETGSELRVGAATITTSSPNLLEPVFRRWGQVLGFAGSFLLIPSLVFGGTFGKGSVNLLNKLLGGARRRVLFHNAMSFWLLGIALVHMTIYLWEVFWGWSHGLVWGGLALSCMIGLGVTGATQRRFVAQWGFNRWRFVHFAMGLLVFVFVLVHIVADGSHLAGVRTMLDDLVQGS